MLPSQLPIVYGRKTLSTMQAPGQDGAGTQDDGGLVLRTSSRSGACSARFSTTSPPHNREAHQRRGDPGQRERLAPGLLRGVYPRPDRGLAMTILLPLA